jgi:hypothetical protein
MDQPEVHKKSIMVNSHNAAHSSSEADTARRKRNRNRGEGGQGEHLRTTFTAPHAGEKIEKVSSLKLWGVTQEVLHSIGFYFVQDELMHLSYNEERIPAELRPHLPPLRPSLSLTRGPDEPSVAQLQVELLNKRLHALKPGTLLSLDGQIRFHVDDADCPRTFQELLALRDVRLHGAGGHQS